MASIALDTVPDSSEALVLRNRRLARRLAQRYVRDGDQREDLEQVAYLGLVEAARRFDPHRGTAFTSFAMPTVLGELRRYCRDTRWALHVPRGTQERVQALCRFEEEFASEHSRLPSRGETAQALGWPTRTCSRPVWRPRRCARSRSTPPWSRPTAGAAS